MSTSFNINQEAPVDGSGIARDLAKKIFMKKQMTLRQQTRDFHDNLNTDRSDIDQTEQIDLVYKSDTYISMEKMIENLKKYRADYCGTRKPIFMYGNKGPQEEEQDFIKSKRLFHKSGFNVSNMSGHQRASYKKKRANNLSLLHKQK